jgi:O-antigen ligase
MSAAIARPGARDRRLRFGLVAVVVAACTGLLVATFPIVAVGVLVAVPVVLAVAPRSMTRDIEIFSGAALLLSALVGVPRQIQVGPITLGAVLSVVELIAAVLLLIHASSRLVSAWRVLWPLVAFLGWSWLSLLRGGASLDGFQNVVVFTSFIAITTLAYVRTVDGGRFAERLEDLFERLYWLIGLLGVASVARYGPGGGFLTPPHSTARSFALVLLPIVASGLARWRYGERARGGLIAVTALVLIALTLSRAAFVTGCALFALAWFSPRSLAGFARLLGGVAVTVALLWAGINFIPPLHDRFFVTRGDLVQVGGYQLNANGRTQLWSETLAQFETSPWVGHGAGSSEEFLAALGGGSHPHNDYLRLLSDYGLVGTTFWALGIVLLVAALYREWVRRDANADRRARFQLWALLSLAGVLATMIADNPLVYMHVQAPLALILGTALVETTA